MSAQPPPLPPARVIPKVAQARQRRAWSGRARALAALLVLVLIGGGLWATALVQERGRSGGDRYTTVLATRGDVTQRLSGTGSVTKVNEEAVRFPTAGEVTEVRVAAGDTVNAGDVLAVMDDTALRTKVLQAQAEVDGAALSLQQARQPGGGASAEGMTGTRLSSGSAGGAGGVGAAAGSQAQPGAAAGAGAGAPAMDAPGGAPQFPPPPAPQIDLGPLTGVIAEADALVAEAAALQAEVDAALEAAAAVCPAPRDPSPTPSASPTPSGSPSARPHPAPSGTPSASPSVTPSGLPAPGTPEPVPSVSASPSVSPDASVTPGVTPSPGNLPGRTTGPSRNGPPRPSPMPPETPAPKPPSPSPDPRDPDDLRACHAALSRVAAAQERLGEVQQRASAANHQGLDLFRAATGALTGAIAQLQAWAAMANDLIASILPPPGSQPPGGLPPGGLPPGGLPPGGLPPGGDVPDGQDPDPDGSAVVSAEVALAKARRALEAAQDDLAAATMKAPMNGVVSTMPFTVGAMATESDRAVVTAPGAVRVTMTVPASSFLHVRPGQAATIRGPGGAEAEASVVEKTLVPTSTGGYPVTVLASGAAAEGFSGGTSATVEIEVSSATDAVVVPLTAVSRTGTDGTVRVLAGNDVVEIPVRLGSIGDTRIEVLEGVQEGDRLVVADAEKPMPGLDFGGPG